MDYGNDIEYVEQKTFIPGEENNNSFFIDDTGHGTGVAGIICAQKNDIGITGINPDIKLYSARVLEKNEAPISRIVEAIYWAIDKKVKIINMSFSTRQDSKILQKAIEDAYDAGILIIAAAGNNDIVEYPAAYEEVLAVGSVNSSGEVAENSASGDAIDVFAPGELVTTSGLLEGTIVESGTSLAAPHVTGVASLLWQKDCDVSADFIRNLIVSSSKKTIDGYDLLDYKYACEIYSDFKENYNEQKNVSPTYYSNSNKLIVYSDNPAVEGKWTDHAGKAKDAGAITSFQEGAAAPDKIDNLSGLTNHHAWHGGRYSNYIADYCYLLKVAEAVGTLSKNATLDEIKCKIDDVSKVTGMDDYVKKGNALVSGYGVKTVYEVMKDELKTEVSLKLKGLNKENKRAYMYGMASHVATDAFAHSTYRYNGNEWVFINHSDDTKVMHADTISCVKKRYEAAKAVLNNIISRYNGKVSTQAYKDFDIAVSYYSSDTIAYSWANLNTNATYRMVNLAYYAKKAGETNTSTINKYNGVTKNDGVSS